MDLTVHRAARGGTEEGRSVAGARVGRGAARCVLACWGHTGYLAPKKLPHPLGPP